MSILGMLKTWDSRRRASIRNVLRDYGFENPIELPAPEYDIKLRGHDEFEVLESEVTWIATAKSYAKNRKIRNIEMAIYSCFNAQRNELIIRFDVITLAPVGSVSEEEMLRFFKKLTAMKTAIEEDLTRALRVFGAWAPKSPSAEEKEGQSNKSR